MQICSGCDNECEIGEQYCMDCLRETEQEDWIDMQPDEPCDHVFVTKFDGSQPYTICEICGEYED